MRRLEPIVTESYIENRKPRGLDTLLDLLSDESNIALWILAM